MPRPKRRGLATHWTSEDIMFLRWWFPNPGCRWQYPNESAPCQNNVPTDAEWVEMRQCYATHRDAVCRPQSDNDIGTRPWSFWEFEAPEPRDMKMPEHEQLRRMGELTADEIRYLELASCPAQS